MSDKYYGANITDEDLNSIKHEIIEAKKRGIIGGHLIELPYTVGQKGEIKEWVSVDIFPDFESKKAKLVFSDNFGEEHCIYYMPIIKQKYLDKWHINTFYAVDKYGEQVPLVNRYLLDIGCTYINEGTPVKTRETAESLDVMSHEKVIKLSDNNNGIVNLNDNEEILNRIIEADESGETVVLELPNNEDYARTSIHISPNLALWGADLRVSDNIISNPNRYYYGFRAIIAYLQHKVGVTNFNVFNSNGNLIDIQNYFDFFQFQN